MHIKAISSILALQVSLSSAYTCAPTVPATVCGSMAAAFYSSRAKASRDAESASLLVSTVQIISSTASIEPYQTQVLAVPSSLVYLSPQPTLASPLQPRQPMPQITQRPSLSLSREQFLPGLGSTRPGSGFQVRGDRNPNWDCDLGRDSPEECSRQAKSFSQRASAKASSILSSRSATQNNQPKNTQNNQPKNTPKNTQRPQQPKGNPKTKNAVPTTFRLVQI